MTDQRKVDRMRMLEGVSGTTAPMNIDGQTWEEFMADARQEATTTPEGREILKNRRLAEVQSHREELRRRAEKSRRLIELRERRQQLQDANTFDGPTALPPEEGEPTIQPNARASAPSPYGQIETAFDIAIGGADVVKTLGVGALGEFGAGLYGATRVLVQGLGHGVEALSSSEVDFNMNPILDETAIAMNEITEAVGVVGGPWTSQGATALQAVAKPIMIADNAARDVSAWAGMGNAAASTAVYTTLMGSLELFGLGKLRHARGIDNVVRNTRSTSRGTAGSIAKARRNEIQALADEMGIILKQDKLSDDVIRIAANQSTHRAANADDLKDALKAADRHARGERQLAVANAQAMYAAVQAGDVVKLGSSLERALTTGGYDLASMPKVADALADLQDINKVSPLTGKRGRTEGPVTIVDRMTDKGTKRVRVDSNEAPKLVLPDNLQRQLDAEQVAKADSIAVGLDEIWTIRQRLDAARISAKKADVLPQQRNPNMAINAVQKQIDEFLDYAYTKDMMKGDPAALAAWRQTDKALAHHNKNFLEVKEIYNMMQEGATPNMVRNYVVGASATAPLPKAASTVRKLKELLGPDSEAIRGIRADYVHELVQPLLDTPPKWDKFIKDWEHLGKNQKHLMDELGMQTTDMNNLSRFAKVAKTLPEKHPFFTREFVAAVLARFGVGHAIAQAGMKVGITRRILGNMIGVDLATQKQILQQAANVSFGAPIIPTSSALGISVTEAAILADLRKVKEQADRKKERDAARR